MDTKTAWQTLRDYAEGRANIDHKGHGMCPDEMEGHDSRDPECPLCQALDATQGCLAQIEEPAGAAPAAAAPLGYVNTQTGQFFTDVEPCRRGNEGHWRTVYLQPSAVAGAVATGWRLVPATPTREWIASVADGGYEDCDCASLIADILSRAPAAPALEAPAALLTKPALVGGGRFGVGVPERYVIEAAQRHHAQEGQREAMTAEQFADEERKRRTLWELIHGPLAAAPQAPRLGEVALHLLRRLLSNQHTLTGPEFRAELEKIVAEESARHAAAPQAPAAPSPYSADLLAALGQWHQRCEVMGAHHTLTEAQIAELVVAGLLRRAHGGQVITTAGRAALAAPAAPAVDAGALRDAEHYRFIKRHRLILSGGTEKYGWPIAPFGDECDRYIAKELAAERAAQAKEGGE